MEESVEEEIERHRRFSEWYAERKLAEALQIMQEDEAKHREKMREWDRWKGAEGVESVSADDEINRGIAAAAERPWTPVIENLQPEGMVSGSVETKLGNRCGVGTLKMEFNGAIYQEYGNVMQVTVEDGHNITTVFIKPDDLLAAVQWMKRLYVAGEED